LISSLYTHTIKSIKGFDLGEINQAANTQFGLMFDKLGVKQLSMKDDNNIFMAEINKHRTKLEPEPIKLTEEQQLIKDIEDDLGMTIEQVFEGYWLQEQIPSV